jgi:MFS family permease
MALGTYNFAGDLGKVTVPALVGLAATWVDWRGATRGYALAGLLAAFALPLVLARLRVGGGQAPALAGAERETPRSSGWGIRDARGFRALSMIHVIDNGTRTAFLTFLPFLLIAKGSSVPAVGFALMLVFAGGAAGKLACGALADRLGVIRTVIITEAATGLSILLLLTLPLGGALALLPVLGIALNGTSSVLYGTVADLVDADRRARSYGVFYTVGVGASALAPFVYGIVSDWVGVAATLSVVGCCVFVTIPLAGALRAPIAAAAAASRT